MPKRNIPNLRSLKTDDLKLLKYMEEKGREIAKRYSIFKITYCTSSSITILQN
jgi:hypothetical protein